MLEKWFPQSISSVAKQIDDLFWWATAWTGGTGLLVVGILLTFIIIYRKRKGHIPFYTHGNTRGALFLTLTLAATVFVALDLNLAYQDHLVWNSMFGRPPKIDEAFRVQIMPEQFAWNIRYPGLDNTFATADDIVTLNELHVPIGKTIVVQLASRDVIHSFFLPNLRIKQDSVPGMVTTLYFTPEQSGQFNIACAEHCGLGHYRMKGDFVVETPEEVQAWLETQAKEPLVSDSWGWDWNVGLSAGQGPTKKKESST